MPEVRPRPRLYRCCPRGPIPIPRRNHRFSQFYIVTGKYYTDMDLDEMEAGRSWRVHARRQREAYKLRAVQHIWMADIQSLVACSMAGAAVDKIQRVGRMTTTVR